MDLFDQPKETRQKAGVFSMSAEQYHASDAVSNSRLKWIAHPKTPAHYRARWITKEIPDEDTEALRIGALTHRCILEPETMQDAFHVKPDGMKFTTKDGIAWRDSHQDRPIVSAEDMDAVHRMAQSVWAHPTAKKILANSDREQSAFAEDGMLLKARFDIVPKSGNLLADLKTCISADLETVQKSILNHSYHRQAAFYLRVAKLLGIERKTFVFIFVEKAPPYAVAVYQLEDFAIKAGRMEVERDLRLLSACMAEDKWPGYSDGIEVASLPEWEIRRLEKEMQP